MALPNFTTQDPPEYKANIDEAIAEGGTLIQAATVDMSVNATSYELGDVPSWARKITLILEDFTTASNVTSYLQIASGVTWLTANYGGIYVGTGSGGNNIVDSDSDDAGIILIDSADGLVTGKKYGRIILERDDVGGFFWNVTWDGYQDGSGATFVKTTWAGQFTFGLLTKLRIVGSYPLSTNITDGLVHIRYE